MNIILKWNIILSDARRSAGRHKSSGQLMGAGASLAATTRHGDGSLQCWKRPPTVWKPDYATASAVHQSSMNSLDDFNRKWYILDGVALPLHCLQFLYFQPIRPVNVAADRLSSNYLFICDIVLSSASLALLHWPRLLYSSHSRSVNIWWHSLNTYSWN